jgi:hypothetical protein
MVEWFITDTYLYKLDWSNVCYSYDGLWNEKCL